MKRTASVLLLAGIMCGSLTGCATASAAMPGTSDKLRIVCTNFPEYDWARQLTKGFESEFEITYLLENGVDMHNYQPSAADLARISCCDLLICVGGESERWVTEALAGSVNPEMKTVRLLDCVTAVEEEAVEGMETKAEEEEVCEEAPEYDEHVWLSVTNAKLCCMGIVNALVELADDSESYAKLEQNFETYLEQLNELDSSFREVSEQAPEKTLIFADRFPFRYFVEDYGYSYYAAFPGCSAETEASFGTVAFLAQKADETGVSVLYTIEGGGTSVAESVRDSTADKNQRIASLNSLQSVTKEQISGGATYISLMEENLNVLKEDAGVQ